MGVNEQLVILLGCDIGYEAYNKAGGFDKFEKYDINEKGEGIVIIDDGSSGHYCYVGLPIFFTPQYDSLGEMCMPKMIIKEMDKEKIAMIKDFVKEMFGVIDNLEFGTHIFIHYT